jgi:transposase-like protein
MSLKDKRYELPALDKVGGRYDRLAIQKIVEAIEGGMRRSEVCLIYGLGRSTISGWMREYGSASYKVHKQGRLNNAQKRSMIRAIREGRMTLQEAKLAYHMSSYNAIIQLLRQDVENSDLVGNMAKKVKTPTGTDEENKKLLKELEEAQLKIKALNTLIDVAEDQFKIPIRKKPGAKQSK